MKKLGLFLAEAGRNILHVLIGILLLVIAIVLLVIGTVPAFIWLLVFSLKKNEDKKARDILKGTGTFFYNIAASFDQTGGVAFGGFFTWWFLTADSKYFFGNFDDTISFVLGYNEKAGTLTPSGKLIVKILHKLDKDHCQVALTGGIEAAHKKIAMYNLLLE